MAVLDVSNSSDEWKGLSVKLNAKVTGVHDVKFVFRGNYDKPANETGLSRDKNAYIHEEDTGMFKFDYWAFEKEPESPAQVVNPPQNQVTPPVASTEKPGTVISDVKPAKVKKLSVKRKGNKAVVSWKKVSDAEKYQLVYSTDKKFKKGVKKLNVKKNKCTVKKLKGKKTYYFKVRAYAGGGYGPYSAKVKIKL